ncbi:UNVERIFIED_CONTAM: hypothetical protein GTU68_002337 [Idotea baltica]|nr:hypothetical protein [Idotea baltica]
MEQDLAEYISENNLCTKQDKILLAVSGGIDSMVLLHLFYKLGYQPAIAHCNFKMRAEASDLDETLVKEVTQKYGFDFYNTSFETSAYAKSKKMGIQEAARTLRYTWFSNIMEEHGYNLLAVAHHQDDQIETVFLNIARGAGIFGLQGMQPKRHHIIRPMLFAQKAEILRYAVEEDVFSREDSSNSESYYRRNFIRNKLIPKIEERVPSFKKRMTENITIWQKSARLLQGLLQEQFLLRRKSEGDQIILEVDKLEASLRDLVIYEWLRPYGFNFSQVTQMIQALDNNHSGRFFYSQRNRVATDRKKLLLSTKTPSESQERLVDKDEKVINLEDGKLEFVLMAGFHEPISQNENIALFDASKIQFPLKIRKWKSGDYFYPLGMQGKKQKLKKFFNNEKYNRFQKENQWLIESEEKICWIVGKRIDDRFKVVPESKYVLKIIWSEI